MTDRRPTFVAFDGPRRLGAGSTGELVIAVKAAADGGAEGPLLIFDNADGRVIDVDLRGSDAEVLARLPPTEEAQPAPPRGRGRPRLGVVAREVTLLPRHWEWLNAQPGGASAAVRKLVEAARRSNADRDRVRQAQEAAYRFMTAIAGDLPGYEEALRALFANDPVRFADRVRDWPADVRDQARSLAFPEPDPNAGDQS